MIDLHMHILPGIDDGAEEMEDAVEMAWTAADSGVRGIAATSHVDPGQGSPEEYLIRYQQQFRALERELQIRGVPIRLYPGMEVFAGKGLIPALRKKQILTLNKSRYLLVEFAFDRPYESMERVLETLLEEGFIPVLAHPERYRCIRHEPQRLYRWYDTGVVLQVNKGSILGEFGGSVQKTAHWMLREQIAGVVASDAHETYGRTSDMEEVRNVLEYTCGIRGAKILLEDNPGKIIADADLIM